MNKKVILILSIIVLIVLCGAFFYYTNNLADNLYAKDDMTVRMLMANGSFDDVIRMKFYSAISLFVIASILPLTFGVITAKHIIKREPIN